jgi:hypothetical protein
MHHWYGIEKIEIEGAKWEWGDYRAALNEPHKNMPNAYRGNFLHGKVRLGDYTHGCICERSQSILAWLWSQRNEVVRVTVQK